MEQVISRYDYETTKNRVQAFLAERNISLFAMIDHYQNAVEVGLTMVPLTVFMFGNAAVGTKLMQENPLVGIVLPLKVGVREENGQVLVFYQNLSEVLGEFSLQQTPIIQNMATLLETMARTVAGVVDEVKPE